MRKKRRVQREKEKADHKKGELQIRLKEAEAALEQMEFETASQIAEEIKLEKKAYFKSLADGAVRILNKIKNIQKKENELKNKLTQFEQKTKDISHSGDFDEATREINSIIEEIDREIYPDLYKDVELKLEWIEEQRIKADTKKKIQKEDFVRQIRLLTSQIWKRQKKLPRN